MSDLIASIKASKLPIICICNDKYKQSLKSLKNHCLEIGWNKPTKVQVAKRLNTIAHAEGLAMNQVRAPLATFCRAPALLEASWTE